MGQKKAISCPCCNDSFSLDLDWWNNQPTNVTECPNCLSLIMIDVEERKAINLHSYLEANYKRFESNSKKRFVVKEQDLISYIPAEEWPE